MASPLDYNPSYPHFWSADLRDALFGAHLNSLSSQFTGFSVCHSIYNDHTMHLSFRHAMYSAILSTEATALYYGFYVAHARHQKVGVWACMCARMHTASP